jgi:hypothetical protein
MQKTLHIRQLSGVHVYAIWFWKNGLEGAAVD